MMKHKRYFVVTKCQTDFFLVSLKEHDFKSVMYKDKRPVKMGTISQRPSRHINIEYLIRRRRLLHLYFIPPEN